jgi:hypothetical protein
LLMPHPLHFFTNTALAANFKPGRSPCSKPSQLPRDPVRVPNPAPPSPSPPSPRGRRSTGTGTSPCARTPCGSTATPSPSATPASSSPPPPPPSCRRPNSPPAPPPPCGGRGPPPPRVHPPAGAGVSFPARRRLALLLSPPRPLPGLGCRPLFASEGGAAADPVPCAGRAPCAGGGSEGGAGRGCRAARDRGEVGAGWERGGET